jgi:hypothetical protein
MKKVITKTSKKKNQISLFEKTMVLKLTGASEEELTAVAHSIHSTPYPLTIGGRAKRKVTISCELSTKPKLIFNGCV